MIIDSCKRTPGNSFSRELLEVWRAIEADAKKLKKAL